MPRIWHIYKDEHGKEYRLTPGEKKILDQALKEQLKKGHSDLLDAIVAPERLHAILNKVENTLFVECGERTVVEKTPWDSLEKKSIFDLLKEEDEE